MCVKLIIYKDHIHWALMISVEIYSTVGVKWNFQYKLYALSTWTAYVRLFCVLQMKVSTSVIGMNAHLMLYGFCSKELSFGFGGQPLQKLLRYKWGPLLAAFSKAASFA